MKRAEEKTKEELISELAQMRQRINELEKLETERKRVEEALEESEQNFRSIFDNAMDGIYIVDVENRKTHSANRKFCQMLGYSPEEMKNLGITDIHRQEDLPDVLQPFEKLLSKESTLAEAIPVKRKDGSVFYADIAAAPVKLGGKTCVVGIFRDITERKQAEERIRELYEHEKELRHSLEEEMKRRVEFTRALVHELKTPLTPILASSDLLIHELQEEPLLGVATNIQRGALTMDTRIDTLLDLAKGELGLLELNYNEVDPLQLLNRVTDEMSSVASSSELSLVLDVPSPLPSLWADESRLQQVILNLLTNAFKWSPRGGKVTLRAKEKDATLIVEVQDVGPGIPEENQQKIFEAYYRVEDDRQRLAGLGLGLALCKTIVELHGGKIWVESERGKGSTFGFSVPLRAAVD